MGEPKIAVVPGSQRVLSARSVKFGATDCRIASVVPLAAAHVGGKGCH